MAFDDSGHHPQWPKVADTVIEALIPAGIIRCHEAHGLVFGPMELSAGLGYTTRQQVRAFEALPALVTILVALLFLLDYRSHSDLLVPSFALVCVMAKDGEVACWFQPFVVSTL